MSLSAADTFRHAGTSGLLRTSPVFPAFPRVFRSPSIDRGSVLVHFLCFDPAFRVLGRLAEVLHEPLVRHLFFTVGLASIVLITPRETDLDTLLAIAGAPPRSSETWRLKNGRIVRITTSVSAPVEIPAEAWKVRKYDQLPLAARSAADEVVSSIALLLPKIAVHIPSELPTFIALARRVDELLAELVYVSRPSGRPPKKLREYKQSDFRNDPSLAETISHQNVDRLIQISAALSYLSTQALSGAVPILERRSLIRRTSLLGVGTAILALTRVTRSIERAFATGALETILADRADDAIALPGLENVGTYDPSGWKQHSVNRWNGKLGSAPTSARLAYFSGRLGFRETEYTISAALQSLAAGADPEWSLLTLTHEMVHGHVRDVLSIVLQDEPDKHPTRKWAQFYKAFAERRLGRRRLDANFSESIRTVLFTYATYAQTLGSLTNVCSPEHVADDKRKVSFDFQELDSDQLRQAVESEYRNISEVIVHVLDFHYFYRSCLSAYIPLIWRSWSTLPQVRADVRQYVLRSLLVAAAKAEGESYVRFDTAVAHLTELLHPLGKRSMPGSGTVTEALKWLTRGELREGLYFPFYASLILVDLAGKVLMSQAIRTAVVRGDPHVGSVRDAEGFEEWFSYDLPLDFVDDEVRSPTAYLAGRLGKKRFQKIESSDLEAETVKMFLACASALGAGGR